MVGWFWCFLCRIRFCEMVDGCCLWNTSTNEIPWVCASDTNSTTARFGRLELSYAKCNTVDQMQYFSGEQHGICIDIVHMHTTHCCWDWWNVSMTLSTIWSKYEFSSKNACSNFSLFMKVFVLYSFHFSQFKESPEICLWGKWMRLMLWYAVAGIRKRTIILFVFE